MVPWGAGFLPTVKNQVARNESEAVGGVGLGDGVGVAEGVGLGVGFGVRLETEPHPMNELKIARLMIATKDKARTLRNTGPPRPTVFR
jgi:hypothetical protein